jgi:DNA repair protein RecO (recombination protein O)
MQTEAEPAFILHSRPYRETSLLVDIFSRHYGRFRAVARGSRGTKKGTKTLTPYTPMLISWTGKTDLKTLGNVEQSGAPLLLTGDALFCGFYLNELLIRLLAENDPHEKLFDIYLSVLTNLMGQEPVEPSLRMFEFSLLEEMGYALVLDTDAETGESIIAEREYWFEPTLGFTLKQDVSVRSNSPNWFQGNELLAIGAGDYRSRSTAAAAKRLIRLALQPHIGNKPLLSRGLFARTPSKETQISSA